MLGVSHVVRSISISHGRTTAARIGKWKMRTADETRKSFIKYFEEQGHVHVPSSSVVPPEGDSSLLFTNAGMNQFKGVLSGMEGSDRWPSRVVNHQKCIRAGGRHNDLDDVGKDLHHLSFFEMMGNWGFHGAYGKDEACRLAWEYLTGVVGIPPDRLYVTYFGGNEEWGVDVDEETKAVWIRLGVSESRILPFVAENFWEMGRTGPCGPSTEIHFDRVEGRSDVSSLVNRDDSVVELWNVVFTNSLREEDGRVVGQKVQHVDTGLGLERLVSVVQRVSSNFDTDLFIPLLEHIQQISSTVPYSGYVGVSTEAQRDCAYRIVADHIRAATVAIEDGVRPSGDDAGFMVRKMIRRAAWRGSQLGMKRGTLNSLIPAVVESLCSAYPSLGAESSTIIETVGKEEERFWKSFDSGEKRFKKEISLMKGSSRVITGEKLFDLHVSYGISPDLCEIWAERRGITLDMDTYHSLRNEAKIRSREADVKKKAVRKS